MPISHDDAAGRLTNLISELAEGFIPKRVPHGRKSTHPWINEAVLRVVREKIDAHGAEAGGM